MKFYQLKGIFTIAIITSIITILSSCKNQEEYIINVAEFGLTEEMDATPVILKIIESINKDGHTKIVFPKGTYHFYDNYAKEFYMAISNNTNGIKRVAFPFMGMKNILIDGQGSEFIFHGLVVPFAFEGSSNIKLENINIDFAKPFYGQAKVVAVHPDLNSFDIKIDGEWEFELHENNLWVSTMYGLVNIGKNIWFDPLTKAPVYNVNAYKIDTWNYWVNDSYEARKVNDSIVRIKTEVSKLPEVGWIWAFKGNGKVRKITAIRVFDSKDLQFENMNIYHCGAMGLVGEKSENIYMKNFNVKLREGSKRIISSTADATHFVNCKGDISFENCVFENMLDDATNVHGIYARITKLIDERTIGVNLIHHEQWGFNFAGPKDTLLISNNETFHAIQRLAVEQVKYINEEYFEIRFTEKINNDINIGYGVENITWQANMTMKNCSVKQNRARSILISTRGKVLVEDNYFSSMMAAILIAGDMNFWFESGAVENVTIKNNTFINHCSSGAGNYVIMVSPNIPKHGLKNNYFHRNIIIDGNTFKTFDRGILFVKCVDSLQFTNNNIEQTFDFKPLFPHYPVIKIESSCKVDISSNKYDWDKDAFIESDSSSVKDLITKDNEGFKRISKI